MWICTTARAKKFIAFAMLHFQVVSPKVTKVLVSSNAGQVLSTILYVKIFRSVCLLQNTSSLLVYIRASAPCMLNDSTREQKRLEERWKSCSVSRRTVRHINGHWLCCKIWLKQKIWNEYPDTQILPEMYDYNCQSHIWEIQTQLTKWLFSWIVSFLLKVLMDDFSLKILFYFPVQELQSILLGNNLLLR